MHTKKNGTQFADALLCEAEGLELLREALTMAGVKGVQVPECFLVNEGQLQMTEITPYPRSEALLQALGQGLALVHKVSQSHFGFHRNNYIGLNP
ncbi:MAG: fructosamine kinase family protein, partial [Pseudohongiellaceae bacterium]